MKHKNVLISNKRYHRNKCMLARMKTTIKRFKFDSRSQQNARDSIKIIAKLAAKKIIHKKTASRKISHIDKRYKQFTLNE